MDHDHVPGPLPEIAERYFAHALPAPDRLARIAHIRFHGRVRLGPERRWTPFRARETITAGESFTVHARTGWAPLPVTVHDVYVDGVATSRVRLLGAVPVRTTRGADADKVAAARLVAESVWLPSAFGPGLGVGWKPRPGGAQITVPVHGETVSAELDLADDGALRELRMHRWSDLTDTGEHGPVPFRTRVEGEDTFDGHTIPSRIRASWGSGRGEFEFFHATVDGAEYVPARG